MNLIAYALVLTATLLGCLVSAQVRAEEGNSTYNFYFQKAPGPVTVNQGGAPAAPSAQAVAPNPQAPIVIHQQQQAPAPAASTAPAPTVDDSYNRPKKWHFSMGYALTNPMGDKPTGRAIYSGDSDLFLSGQYALKGEYDLSERFSITGEIYKFKQEVDTNEVHQIDPVTGQSMGGWNVRSLAGNRPAEKNVIDFSVGAAANIVRLRSTTLSLIGGVVTSPVKHYELDRRTNVATIQGGVKHEKSLYAGARLRLIADNVWGLDFSYKALVGFGHGIGQLGLTFAL